MLSRVVPLLVAVAAAAGGAAGEGYHYFFSDGVEDVDVTHPPAGAPWNLSSVTFVDDAPLEPHDLHFALPFFERTFDRLSVSPNGDVHLTPYPVGGVEGACCSVSNGALCAYDGPAPFDCFLYGYRNAILPFLTDLNPQDNTTLTGRRVETRNTAAAFTVRYVDVGLYFSPLYTGDGRDSAFSFSCTVFPSGRIVVRYEDIEPLPPLVDGWGSSTLRNYAVGMRHELIDERFATSNIPGAVSAFATDYLPITNQFTNGVYAPKDEVQSGRTLTWVPSGQPACLSPSVAGRSGGSAVRVVFPRPGLAAALNEGLEYRCAFWAPGGDLATAGVETDGTLSALDSDATPWIECAVPAGLEAALGVNASLGVPGAGAAVSVALVVRVAAGLSAAESPVRGAAGGDELLRVPDGEPLELRLVPDDDPALADPAALLALEALCDQCGGNAALDGTVCVADCNGVWNGSAAVECGLCAGGDTGVDPASLRDCEGECKSESGSELSAQAGGFCGCAAASSAAAGTNASSCFAVSGTLDAAGGPGGASGGGSEELCLSPRYAGVSASGGARRVLLSGAALAGGASGLRVTFGGVNATACTAAATVPGSVLCEPPAGPAAGVTVRVRVFNDTAAADDDDDDDDGGTSGELAVGSAKLYFTYLADDDPRVLELYAAAAVDAASGSADWLAVAQVQCADCAAADSEACVADCNGTFKGAAEVDDCGVCAGGLDGPAPNADKDCRGVCSGPFEADAGGSGLCACVAPSDAGGAGSPCVEYATVAGEPGFSAGDGVCATPRFVTTAGPAGESVRVVLAPAAEPAAAEPAAGGPNATFRCAVGGAPTAASDVGADAEGRWSAVCELPAGLPVNGTVEVVPQRVRYNASAGEDPLDAALPSGQVAAALPEGVAALFVTRLRAGDPRLEAPGEDATPEEVEQYEISTACGDCGPILNESFCVQDCAGTFRGDAAEDECGNCTGGASGLEAGFAKDCQGHCFGPFEENAAGRCACPASSASECYTRATEDGARSPNALDAGACVGPREVTPAQLGGGGAVEVALSFEPFIWGSFSSDVLSFECVVRHTPAVADAGGGSTTETVSAAAAGSYGEQRVCTLPSGPSFAAGDTLEVALRATAVSTVEVGTGLNSTVVRVVDTLARAPELSTEAYACEWCGGELDGVSSRCERDCSGTWQGELTEVCGRCVARPEDANDCAGVCGGPFGPVDVGGGVELPCACVAADAADLSCSNYTGTLASTLEGVNAAGRPPYEDTALAAAGLVASFACVTPRFGDAGGGSRVRVVAPGRSGGEDFSDLACVFGAAESAGVADSDGAGTGADLVGWYCAVPAAGAAPPAGGSITVPFRVRRGEDAPTLSPPQFYTYVGGDDARLGGGVDAGLAACAECSGVGDACPPGSSCPGVVNLPPDEECPRDCSGAVGGEAAENDCGTCQGGWTGVPAGDERDCAGVCDGAMTELGAGGVCACAAAYSGSGSTDDDACAASRQAPDPGVGHEFCVTPRFGPAAGGSEVRVGVSPEYTLGVRFSELEARRQRDPTVLGVSYACEFGGERARAGTARYDADTDTLRCVVPPVAAGVVAAGEEGNTSVTVPVRVFYTLARGGGSADAEAEVVPPGEQFLWFTYLPNDVDDPAAEADPCDDCSDDTFASCRVDCAGEPGGTAALDRCGLCRGGSTGQTANAAADCAGVCFGPFLDEGAGCACVQGIGDTSCTGWAAAISAANLGAADDDLSDPERLARERYHVAAVVPADSAVAAKASDEDEGEDGGEFVPLFANLTAAAAAGDEAVPFARVALPAAVTFFGVAYDHAWVSPHGAVHFRVAGAGAAPLTTAMPSDETAYPPSVAEAPSLSPSPVQLPVGGLVAGYMTEFDTAALAAGLSSVRYRATASGGLAVRYEGMRLASRARFVFDGGSEATAAAAEAGTQDHAAARYTFEVRVGAAGGTSTVYESMSGPPSSYGGWLAAEDGAALPRQLMVGARAPLWSYATGDPRLDAATRPLANAGALATGGALVASCELGLVLCVVPREVPPNETATVVVAVSGAECLAQLEDVLRCAAGAELAAAPVVRAEEGLVECELPALPANTTVIVQLVLPESAGWRGGTGAAEGGAPAPDGYVALLPGASGQLMSVTAAAGTARPAESPAPGADAVCDACGAGSGYCVECADADECGACGSSAGTALDCAGNCYGPMGPVSTDDGRRDECGCREQSGQLPSSVSSSIPVVTNGYDSAALSFIGVPLVGQFILCAHFGPAHGPGTVAEATESMEYAKVCVLAVAAAAIAAVLAASAARAAAAAWAALSRRAGERAAARKAAASSSTYHLSAAADDQ